MKERIRDLNRYQKSILIILIVMMIVFAVLYPLTISKEGYQFNNTIFVPQTEGGLLVYSGKIEGAEASFTVSKDEAAKSRTVTFKCADKTYGPYTITEDPSAVPDGKNMSPCLFGVEVRCKDEVIYRGGVEKLPDMGFLMLFNEDGEPEAEINVMFTDMYNGFYVDESGNRIDPLEPSVYTLIDIAYDPEPVHKGNGSIWFLAVFVCVICFISVLYADKMFRFDLAFRVRDPENAEPSDLQIAGRYISWTILAVAALAIFIMGLR